MPAENWTIRLLGGFCIESPKGDEVKIPSRKARALVALLALNDGIAVPRELLGQQLWPEKQKLNQQQNLRQAITQLKDAFAAEQAVEATRDTCRLTLNYYCDALECLTSGRDAGALTFLPEMPEPIFESYRSELASYAPIGDLGEAVRGAATLLEWAIVREPVRALDMLYNCRELIPSMPLPLVENALRASLKGAPDDHPLHHWGRSLFATVLMWAGRFDEGILVAKEALGLLQPVRDAVEWTAAAHTASCFLIFRGRFAKAKELIASAMEIAEFHKLEDAVNRFKHARALCFGYEGELAEALKIMESLPKSPIINAHMATYYIVSGDSVKAREKLELAKSEQRGQTDSRLACQIGLAEAYTLGAEGKVDEAKALMTDMFNLCESYGMQFPTIHALEGLAVLATDETEIRKNIERAMDMRSRHRYPILPGDKVRLAKVLPYLLEYSG